MVSARTRDALLFAVALIGLGVSALLLNEYLGPAHEHAMCGEGGGCASVRHSDYASFVGIPTPAFGVVFFAVVTALCVLSDARTRRWLAVLTAAGAAAGVGFIVLQAAVVGALCAYCLVVDVSAIAAFGLAWSLREEPLPERSVAARVGLAVAVAAFGFALPSLVGGDGDDMVVVGGIPEFVQKAQQPGVVTIVEFMDFECPNCRRFHDTMKTVTSEYGDKVRVIYRQLPLSMHKNAIHGARGAVCAAEQDTEAAMTDRLFKTNDLTPEGVAREAEVLGLDMETFRACVGAERTAARIQRDGQDAEKAGVMAVPTFWVGTERFRGARSEAELRSAINNIMK